MHPMCNPLKCEAYAEGWCEYDPLTDTVYPAEESKCLLREEET